MRKIIDLSFDEQLTNGCFLKKHGELIIFISRIDYFY